MTQESPKIAEADEQLGIDQLIDQYKNSEDFVHRAKTENSQSAYNLDLRQFGKFCQTHEILALAQLTPQVMSEWVDEMKTGDYKLASINRKLASMKEGFFDWLIVRGSVSQDFKIDLPDYFKTQRRPAEILKFSQIRKLINAIKKEDLRAAALVQIALKTGGKTSEIVQMKTQDVLIDPTNDQVLVRLSTPGKNNGRTIILDREAGETIKEYLQETRVKPDEYLFTNKRGKNKKTEHLSRQGFWSILEQYGREIGLPNLNPQILRNTFIVNFRGDVKELSDILGMSLSNATKVRSLI